MRLYTIHCLYHEKQYLWSLRILAAWIRYHGSCYGQAKINFYGIRTLPYDEEDWEFDLFGDMDIVTCLYSDM